TVWETPAATARHPGSLRARVAALAEREAVRELRRRHHPGTDGPWEERVRAATAAARAAYVQDAMPPPLRLALDHTAHRRDYRLTAHRLGVPADEVRHRLRLGLQLLAHA